MASKPINSPSTLFHLSPCPCKSNTSHRPAADCSLGCKLCRLGTLPCRISQSPSNSTVLILSSTITNLGYNTRNHLDFYEDLLTLTCRRSLHLIVDQIPPIRPISIASYPSPPSHLKHPAPVPPHLSILRHKASVPISPNAQPRQRKATWQRHKVPKRGDKDGDGITFGSST